MGSYRHTKGVITDNALQALLHDPLFRVRTEKNKKGKAVISVKTVITGRTVERAMKT